MATTQQLKVKELVLDLKNYRTVAQDNEIDAIKAMITISPDYFWGLMNSLLDDGYLPTENIIILRENNVDLVKEGNRRIASLKIIHGYIDKSNFDLPSEIETRINELPDTWRVQNEMVPCTIYDKNEADLVDKIVTLTHGKGQKAGRDDWETVARARHNQQVNSAPEYGLALLEKYLEHGQNHSTEQKLRWSGKYNLSVLNEALPKIYERVDCTSVMDLALNYPNIKYKKELESVIYAIGLEELKFPDIRTSSDFLIRYGFPPLNTKKNTTNINSNNTSSSTPNAPTGTNNSSSNTSSQNSSGSSGTNGTAANSSTPNSNTSAANNGSSSAKKSATSTNDIKTVRKLLRSLKLFGPNRSKLLDIKKEMVKLKPEEHPIAFIFLLRCMIEISAKAYCDDISSSQGSPKYVKADGSDRNLADVLRDIVSYLTQNKTDKQMVKLLHGPLTEITRQDGLLSITSMNQLVHNPNFVIRSNDIPGLFVCIFPLIEKMNN
ncbi:hypothetical protein MA314_004987 [Klebsiella pneumoniae]